MVLEILVIVLLLLILNELILKNSNKINEFNRKFVHISVGSFIAFWPFLISWQDIRLISLAFVAVVLVSRRWNIFKGIHTVVRPTMGEVLFAIAVGGLTYLTSNNWIYLVAILQMSLADGLAAMIGTNFGKKNSYRVFGQIKSIIGSLGFFISSFILLIVYGILSAVQLPVYLIINFSLFLTLIENVGIFGLDNLLVPVFTVWFLKLVA